MFVAGLQLTCTGFVGEYIGRIYDEVRARPLFVINNILRSSSADTPYLVREYAPIAVQKSVMPETATQPSAAAPAASVVTTPAAA